MSAHGEIVPAGEAAQIRELLAIFQAIQEARDRRQQPVPRNVHPKQHGCVRAELQIEPDLPAVFRQGVFRAERAFPALVRFSNAKQRDDRLPDGHGLAVKLLDVEGHKLLAADADARTQDFVLIDHPVFFARDIADILPLARDYQRVMLGGVLTKVAIGLKGLLSPSPRYRRVRQTGRKRPANPLASQYWSTTPYALGDAVMKFSIRPQSDGPAVPSARSEDRLRLAMAAWLREREARFDFLVQLQTNPATMPVEDATVAWDEAASPFRKVGTLVIPPQEFQSPRQIEFGENLSFTPWHALVEHQPLGGINRARKKIYEAMSARRHELNGAPQREPTLAEVRALFG